MEIRKAERSDLLKLIELIQIIEEKTVKEISRKVKKFTESDKVFFIIVLLDSKITGYLLFAISENDERASKFLDISKHCCVRWIAVHPEFRRKNIGSRLLQESEKYARKYGKLGIWLDCRERAVSFYEKNGYRIAGVYPKESSSGKLKPCYVMVKP